MEADLLKACASITAGYTPGGDKMQTYHSGATLARWLVQQSILKPRQKILDVGSGNGRVAMGIADIGMPIIEYHGVEIIRPCVDFCSRAFATRRQFRFHHADIRSDHYWGQGKIEPAAYRFEFADEVFDLIIAMSLFSHTGTLVVARNYLAEMARMLKPGGVIFSTWYFTDDISLVSEQQDRTIYQECTINLLAARCGLACSGLTWVLSDQQILVMKKGAQA